MRFLFATDGSRGAQIARSFLLGLPLSRADHVTVLTCPAYTFFGTEALDPGVLARARGEAERGADLVLREVLTAFRARAVPVHVVLRDGPVAQAAQLLAIEEASDVIVVGSRGLGTFTGVLMGSVARALARHAPTPVLVVRGRSAPPERIVAAVDGSDDARAAIMLLARMPLPSSARVTLLHVLPTPAQSLSGSDEIVAALRSAEQSAASRVMAEASHLLGDHIVDHHIVERGHVAEQIIARAAALPADLIVLGSRGQTLGSGFLQGSVADQVLSAAHCAVLVAKAPLAARTVPAYIRDAVASAV